MRSDVGAPRPLAAFVGRERETEAVRGLLAATRLLTLTGAGGSGKTRIAIEVIGTRPDVVWVELAGITDPARVPAEVAEQLGIREATSGLTEAIANALREGPRLLVVDNCEHVIEAAAQLVAAVLRACPQLSVLATSREPLALPGERAWLVPALSVPPRGARDVDPTTFDATRLFVERARDVQPDFTVDAAGAAIVAEICRRLDGLPLAIELAAARVRVLALDQILARLHDRFKLLASTSRAAAPRHQTLRATMDWSFALLAPEEQALLLRLSVFTGDFSLDAAESVCSTGELPAGDVLDVLARLVDRSLVVMREASGIARYGLLETVRQYAAERLRASGGEHALRRRHAEYVGALVAMAAPHLTKVTRRPWYERLERELGDIRAALVWTCEHDHERHVELVAGLGWYWFSAGTWSEARAWFDGALAMEPARAPTRLRARMFVSASVIACLQVQGATAVPWLEEAIAICRAHGDRELEAYALNYLGMASIQLERLDADVPIRAALEWFRANGDLYGLRLSWLLLAQRQMGLLRDPEGALPLFVEALATARAFGLPRELGIASQLMGAIQLLRRDYAAAADHVRESIACFQADPQAYFMSRNLDVCAVLAVRLHQDDALAARLIGAAEAVRIRVGAIHLPTDRAALQPVHDEVRGRMGQVAFDAEVAAGRSLELDPAVVLALEVARPRTPAPPPTPSVPARPPARVEAAPGLVVRGLGPLEIQLDDRRLERTAWGSPRARELLLYLLAHPHGRRREDIGLVFWPEASAAQVKNSFHVLLHRLRKVLGRHDVVIVEDERYGINPALAPWFDAAVFEREVKAAKRDADRLAAAIALYRGDLFEGEVAGEWHLDLQDRLRALHRDALSTLADLRLDDAGAAVRILEELVRVDELREDAHRRLLLCYARIGQRDRALLQYERLVELLRTELAANPSRATVELADKIRRAEAV